MAIIDEVMVSQRTAFTKTRPNPRSYLYLWIDLPLYLGTVPLWKNQIITSKGYGTSARVSVNFRKFSPCMARARIVRAGLTALPPMRDFGSLILAEY